MFIRYNNTAKYYEYDTSAGQTGAGPWVMLPISSASIIGPGGGATNVAYTDRINQFGINQRINNALGDFPRLTLTNLGRGVNAKVWQMLNIDDNLSFWALSDAEDAVMGQFAIDRTGTVIAGLVPSARLSANVALTDKANLFNAAQSINAALQLYGHIIWYRADAPADAKLWHNLPSSAGSYQLYPTNDAQNAIQNPGFLFGRDGVFALSSGVRFPAAQAASADVNTLDDYEEGNWTPYFFSSDGGSGTAYAVQVGRYTKIGNFVTCHYDVQVTSANWASGYLYLGGLPFQPTNTSTTSSGTIISYASLAKPVYSITWHVYSGIPYGHINYKATLSTGNDGAILVTDIVGGFNIQGTCRYRSD